MGREIVESEQGSQALAGNGKALIRSVSEALQAQFGRGSRYSNVKHRRHGIAPI